MPDRYREPEGLRTFRNLWDVSMRQRPSRLCPCLRFDLSDKESFFDSKTRGSIVSSASATPTHVAHSGDPD